MHPFFIRCKNKTINRRWQKKLLLIAFGFICFTTHAQVMPTNSTYAQAEKYFNDKKYFEAAQLYEKYLSAEEPPPAVTDPFAVSKRGKEKASTKNVTRQEALFYLAESHRLTHDFNQAEKWYKEVIALPDHNPLAEYWYGVTLRTNQKFEEAFHVLTTFVETYPNEDEWKESAKLELSNLQFIKGQEENQTVNVFVRPEINEKNKSAYALVVPGAKAVAFTSIYVDSAAMRKGKYAYFARLYSSVESRTIMDSMQMLQIQSQKGYHEGLATFTNEGRTMFFTRWTDKKGKRISDLYRSDKTASGWSKPEKLGAPFNLPGFNSTQPFITPDKKYMLFSSNRPGGSGNYDIWYAPLDSSLSATEAINFGKSINTSGDDMSPYYHQNTQNLVFSSNGRTGMGGFDIYAAQGEIPASQWQSVVNPGSPVNSPKDDMYFISTDDDELWKNGWFSSDRGSDCCLEVFAFNRDNEQHITGIVIDRVTGHPIPGATITLKDVGKENGEETIAITDKDGHYHFDLTDTKKIQIEANNPGFDSVTGEYNIGIKTGRDSLTVDTMFLTETRKNPDVDLTGTDPPDSTNGEIHDPDVGKPPPDHDPDVGKPPPIHDPDLDKFIGDINRQMIHFDFRKSDIKEKYYPYLDSIVSIMERYPSLKIEMGGHTDGLGTNEFNGLLGQDRVQAVVQYIVNKGIDADRVTGTSYGETLPIASETRNGLDDPRGRFMNRRVEFRIVRSESAIPPFVDNSAGQNALQRTSDELSVKGSRKSPDRDESEREMTSRERRKTGNPVERRLLNYDASEFATTVHYSFDKAVINSSYYRSLDTLAQLMLESPSLRLLVNGYTDSKGSAAYNLQLADERVKSCINYLVKKGVDRARIEGEAYGECCPVAEEIVNGKDDRKARWLNRRVEFRWLKE
ncbi:OmpA family protein [Pollutibacter soli]|uniref:OmpA family protein n=1 Tax=Pollutibacter soli TaxID=3034157 RepID=UPI003014076A